MPQYKYQVLDEGGQLKTGQSAAEYEHNLLQRLKSYGYTVLDIKEVKKNRPFGNSFIFKPRVGLEELDFFSRQLAAMLAAGIPVSRSLMVLYQQTQVTLWRRILENITRDVESGTSLSEALGCYPGIFSPLYIDMIKAGEISGQLDQMLMSLSRQLAQQKKLRDQIRTATFYPAFILTFAGFVVLLLMLFLMPLMVGMLPPHTPLPLPTRVVMMVSMSIGHYWYLYILFLAGCFVCMGFYLRSVPGQVNWHRLKFKIPLMGTLWKKALLARFCRLLALLLAAGLPILTALKATAAALGNVWFAVIIDYMIAHIQEGEGVSDALALHDFFPPVLINMVAVGEESGNLSELLHKVADFYEEETTVATKGLTALIEPVLIVVVGILVGFLMIAVYLPIFTAVTAVGE